MYAKKLYEYRGREYSLTELVKMSNFCRETIAKRLDMGWTVEEALTTPAGKSMQIHTINDLGKHIPIVFHIRPPVYRDLQPVLGKQYIAKICGSSRRDASCRFFYTLKLDNGKTLITYPGEFEILKTDL